MDNEILYDAIFHRKSVRKYDSAPLNKEILAKLNEFALTAIPLIPEIDTEFRVLTGADIHADAPQCMCLYSQKKDGWRMNAGFLTEQIDLYLSANNIGACWLGSTQPHKTVCPPDGMEWVATLEFGTPAQIMHRSAASEFKRKSLNEISDITDLYHVLEAVRLAPSAMDKQPWFFGGNASNVIVSRKKSMLLDKLNQLDIGIALCCFMLSLKHLGKTAQFSFEPQPVPEKSIFMATINIQP
ncbi:MAG: nitroreductase family protein [Christensenella sp.]